MLYKIEYCVHVYFHIFIIQINSIICIFNIFNLYMNFWIRQWPDPLCWADWGEGGGDGEFLNFLIFISTNWIIYGYKKFKIYLNIINMHDFVHF